MSLAVEILAAYAQARRALRKAPIASVVAVLRSQTPSAEFPDSRSLEEARRLGRAVSRLLSHVPGDTRCLARSLVLTRLLARRGIEAKLVIGARAKPEFLAHAWVEYEGDPVLDPGDGSFGRLVEL
jgi:Transglutaminase-like superfamily